MLQSCIYFFSFLRFVRQQGGLCIILFCQSQIESSFSLEKRGICICAFSIFPPLLLFLPTRPRRNGFIFFFTYFVQLLVQLVRAIILEMRRRGNSCQSLVKNEIKKLLSGIKRKKIEIERKSGVFSFLTQFALCDNRFFCCFQNSHRQIAIFLSF